MNELISQEKEKEIINQVLEFLDSDNPINDISEFLEDEIRNINKNFKDIGLKDINGKNIYADRSIFEITLANRYKTKGYFYFDIKNLRYFFAFIDLHIMAVEKFSEYYKKAHSHNYIDEKIFWSMEYSFELFSDIKIIDTIQENKLGLIK